jgi:adenylate kinase family enzyme
LQVYQRETAPLIAYYRDADQLKTVTAEGPVETVYASLVAMLGLD